MQADSELISRAAGGDTAAFQMLVEQHRSMVYRVAYQFAPIFPGLTLVEAFPQTIVKSAMMRML